MSGLDSRSAIQWREALFWLAKAGEDLAAGRVLMDADMLAPAAFHIQQALEKGLKGLLVAAAEDIRKTHDIDTLATTAQRHWPALIPTPFPLAHLTSWYLVSRYPGLDESEPTLSSIRDALHAVEALLAEVRREIPPYPVEPEQGAASEP